MEETRQIKNYVELPAGQLHLHYYDVIQLGILIIKQRVLVCTVEEVNSLKEIQVALKRGLDNLLIRIQHRQKILMVLTRSTVSSAQVGAKTVTLPNTTGENFMTCQY